MKSSFILFYWKSELFRKLKCEHNSIWALFKGLEAFLQVPALVAVGVQKYCNWKLAVIEKEQTEKKTNTEIPIFAFLIYCWVGVGPYLYYMELHIFVIINRFSYPPSGSYRGLGGPFGLFQGPLALTSSFQGHYQKTEICEISKVGVMP